MLLGAALALLASLYLPWQTAPCGQDCALGPGNVGFEGWTAQAGGGAALVALLLAAVAGAALVRPNLLGRLPLELCALLVGYFGLAVGAETRSLAHVRGAAAGAPVYHLGPGTYLGVAASIVALVVAGVMRRRALDPAFLATAVLGIGVLVSFLLPWQAYFLGITTPAAILGAAAVVCLLALPANRLALALVALLFTGAAFSALSFPVSHRYGAWIGLGLAIGLLAVAVATGRGLPSHEPPRGLALAAVGAGVVLVTSLFFPWQSTCYSGRCLSSNGWTSTLGATAALLAIGLLILFVAPRRFLSPGALGVGIALLVASLGFELQHGNEEGVHLSYGYGAMIGCAATALLLVLSLVGVRAPKLSIRLAPVAACIAYLIVVAVPWWGVLSQSMQSHFAGFQTLTWLTIAGALLAVWLAQLWLARDSAGAEWLVIVPLGMLSLEALYLIRWRSFSFPWGGWIVVGLCLVLAAFGWVEQRGGMDDAHVPSVLRLDRL